MTMSGITFYRRRGRMSNDFENGIAKILEENAKADAKADSLLDKLKGSKWTALIVVAVAVIVVVWLVG
jgi:hypothetical protein